MASEKTKLLVVDDELEVGSILKHYLSARDYAVESVSSGEAALKTLESENFDIVILDILMHGLNGEIVAKIIKEKYPKTKVIVVTAFPDAAWHVSRDVDIDGCFVKPLLLEDIYNKLQGLQFV